MKTLTPPRKIIHIDMDCFYAAIEMRDDASLRDKAVAVGGPSHHRGVICTCNYLARESGVRAAMPTKMASQLCPELILLPVNMPKYKAVARSIHQIFREFTDIVEPLSLDEAFLDVSGSTMYQGSATRMAQAIRERIWKMEQLTASAGVAPNKFLAKIASGWKKPNGLFVIPPKDVQAFVKTLPVSELFGVGKVTLAKLHRFGLKTCADLQAWSLIQLTETFGKMGKQLYEQSRGLDTRDVQPDRARKSLSVEETFTDNLKGLRAGTSILESLFQQLQKRLDDLKSKPPIKNQFVKIKFHDFQLRTAEIAASEISVEGYRSLLKQLIEKNAKPMRLIGIGVHFEEEKIAEKMMQEILL